mgnify:CR=1 FL=1
MSERHPATAPDLAGLSPRAQGEIIADTNPDIPRFVFTDEENDKPSWMQPLQPEQEEQIGVEDITHPYLPAGVHPQPLSPLNVSEQWKR